MLFVPGPDGEGIRAACQTLSPAPMIFDRRWTDRETGQVLTLSRLVRLDFADLENAALLPLEKVAELLERFPWGAHPGLRVNRLDLASDHVVSSPKRTCDRIAELRLPYSRPYRGPENAAEPWLSVYHNAGKAWGPRVAVIHYPRLESRLRSYPQPGSAATDYLSRRVRQEVRLRGQGLRQRFGGGAMTPDVVFRSFPTLVGFAERRLKPVFEAGILSPPPRDPAGETALASVVERWPLTGTEHQREQP